MGRKKESQGFYSEGILSFSGWCVFAYLTSLQGGLSE